MTPQREEWNDRALDQLEARVENLERDADALSARIAEPPSRRATWLGFVLTLATGVIVPIAVAAIGAWAIVRAAGI
jgi:hypothetical protein